MKNILVPTDFSPISEKALKYAIEFSAETGHSSQIILLNTYLVPKLNNSCIIQVNDKIKLHSKNEIEKQKSKVLCQLKDGEIDIKTTIILGTLSNVVPRAIVEKNIDMLIMGKDNGKHIEEISRVLKNFKINCPLLTVS